MLSVEDSKHFQGSSRFERMPNLSPIIQKRTLHTKQGLREFRPDLQRIALVSSQYDAHRWCISKVTVLSGTVLFPQFQLLRIAPVTL